LDIVKRFFKTKGEIKPRYAHYGELYDEEGNLLDEGVLIYYKAPRSYTGEDMVELNLHGNPAILKRAVELFVKAGARLAEPGEFTKRAFLSGKLDLTQAEAVAELISAKTELARRVALKQLKGELSKLVKPLREKLLTLSAYLEAEIEFAEEDLPTLSREEVLKMVREVLKGVRELLKTARTGKALREGIKLAIVGRPNVGKSSLFNALLKEERAIVTEIAGTTRDYIEETLQIKGVPVKLVDTAGIRETEDPVERIGVERSKKKLEEADLVLFVVDLSSPLTEEDLKIYELVKEKEHLVVANKADLPQRAELEKIPTENIIKVSALTGEGLEELSERILSKAGVQLQDSVNVYVSLRHEELLKKAEAALERLEKLYKEGEPSPEIAMLEVREASDYLGEILGEITTEELLGKIFSTFCIGK